MLPPDIAIRVSSLSKKYRLFDTPRARLKEALDPRRRTFHKDFWALQDVSFEVPKGQTVGIIGRNGSGKSTLLQILTGVMPPTTGSVELAGRVTALLELGAGFDPQFSGRDNVRQFGRLQGMSAEEIERRLPDVEAFAGIGEFFDREVRSYSSGMFARLAFAAAINVDPDILILDEILAVGDARFQQRCYERIQSIQAAGKTVLIVSHSLETIIDHCDSAILIDRGHMVAQGDPKAVTDCYREILFDEVVQELGDVGDLSPRAPKAAAPQGEVMPPLVSQLLSSADGSDRFHWRTGYNKQETSAGDGDAQLLDYRIEVAGEEARTDLFLVGTVIRLHVLLHSETAHQHIEFGIALRRQDGHFIYGSNSVMRPNAFERWKRGTHTVFTTSLRLNIQSGSYFLDLGAFLDVGGETYRLKTRRNCIQLWVMHTPHFDGSVDIAVLPEPDHSATPQIVTRP